MFSVILSILLMANTYKLNPNLDFLHHSFKTGKSGVVLEGSSRSGKTWSSVDFIIWLCSTVETDATINIIKETYNSFKTTLFEDFDRRLPDYGIPSPFAGKKEIHSFFLFGNRINFLGADSESVMHGVGSDYTWINESLDVSEQIFNQAEQRCRKFWWMDYNPKTTDHWVYDKVCNRPDVGFMKTTFLDNPGISRIEKQKILGYEPTHPDDRSLAEEKRRPHPENIKNGTADDFMWQVYGLGNRAAPEGVVFRHVTWIKDFPKDVERIYYGLDFGYTNSPSALSKIAPWINGPEKRLYIQKLLYQPTESSGDLIKLLDDLVASGQITKDIALWCDSEGDQMIRGLRQAKWKAFGVNKFSGSVKEGIALLKEYSLHIVKSPEFEKEQANYKWREVNGIRLDEPLKEHDHLWDATRYAALSNLRHAKT